MRINDAEQLLHAVYQDWSNYLLNPRFTRVKRSSIAWVGYSPRMLEYPVMVSDVTRLSEDGQYSFQWFDGSLFQIYYQYDARGDSLVAANLAFFSSRTLIETNPDKLSQEALQLEDTLEDDTSEDQDAIEDTPDNLKPSAPLAQEDEGMAENITDGMQASTVLAQDDSQEEQNQPEQDVYIASQEGIANWLRIDYAPHQARGVLHYDCHMHLSMFNNSRLIVDGIPNPRQFVEFVVALCYPDIYGEHRLKDGEYVDQAFMHTVNSPCLPGKANLVCKHITHLRVPDTLGKTN